jgi:hypothetical protein
MTQRFRTLELTTVKGLNHLADALKHADDLVHVHLSPADDLRWHICQGNTASKLIVALRPEYR